MTKSFFVAIGMGIVLFLYGYVLSTIGHDHASHSHSANEEMKTEPVHDHSDHDHH